MSNDGSMPVFDGHNDTLLNIYLPERGKGRSFFERSEQGHLDLPRAREGGFGGGLFAVFVPRESGPDDDPENGMPGPDGDWAAPVEHGYAHRTAVALTAGLLRLEEESQGQLKLVRTADEVEACLSQGVLAAVLHFEGAEPIDIGLDALHVFYAAGLRSLGIVWSRPNAFGHGAPIDRVEQSDPGPGLTAAGRELVRACNRLGIMIDLSHLNQPGFWDVAELSDAPLVATHSCVYTISPSPRNLTDEQLDAIGQSGGLVGINFYVGFLRSDGLSDANTPLTEIVRHIDYVAERIGIDHVAFGSDFDGATIPYEMGDVTGLPRLVTALRERGYDDQALTKLTHQNWLRVLRQTWKDGRSW
jgi:membrane dipeptidase